MTPQEHVALLDDSSKLSLAAAHVASAARAMRLAHARLDAYSPQDARDILALLDAAQLLQDMIVAKRVELATRAGSPEVAR